ncbi:AAA family ATPase [Bifidobacterium callimiconis]|uniref:ATPase n=1 Tax=Bifidobacterium callimiconis TaxID=2306973 RepID=A0A430FGY4_9BIFI|nr:AAA family ATPase [Bifidobacterium callimiconis]RSX52032.1 ATPase [Bifidobacterium callimiconis]
MDDSKYGWIPFYEELANTIRPLRADRSALYNKAKEIYTKAGMKLPTLESDGAPVDLDPFTFFAQFNKRITKTNRIALAKAIAESFGLNSPVPTEFAGIPFINNQRSTFYSFRSDPGRGERDIDNLWDLFESALDYADSPNAVNRESFIQSLSRVLPQKGIKWNITMGLFWIRPQFYLSLDGRSRWFLGLPDSMKNTVKKYSIPVLSASMPSDIADNANDLFGKNEMMDAATYLSFVERCRSVLDKGGYGEYKYHSFPELSNYALAESGSVNKQIKAFKKRKPVGDIDDVVDDEIADEHDDALPDFDSDEDDTDTTEIKQADPLKESFNLVYFGAPGTGKSYELDKLVHDNLQDHYERVTFYADYQHAQFVGGYKPVMADGQIEYRFRPGPFTRVLVKALNDQRNNYALVIEELNRAEAASVFGDLFQLLDRSANGMSEYPVSVSEDLREFLVENLTSEGKDYLYSQIEAGTGDDVSAETDCTRILIPRNMYIWATMNSADQGVFPLDTAFKRRWDFRYVGIDEGEEYSDMPVWNEQRKKINKLLLEAGVNEDKQIGPFFIHRVPDFGEESQEQPGAFDNAMKNKVLMYLFEDAAKYHRDIFSIKGVDNNALSLQTLCQAWDKNNFGIFRGLEKIEEVKSEPVEGIGSGESETPDAPGLTVDEQSVPVQSEATAVEE